MEKKQRRVNWRGGLLYLLFVQIEVIVCALFLTFAVYPIRMIFDVGMARDFFEAFLLVIIELAIRFFIFLAIFTNQKRLTFAYFAGGYGITVGIRFVFSLLTKFAAWSAGMGILTTSSSIATHLTEREIKSMTDIPMIISIVVFVAFEALSLLMAILASRLAEAKREKERNELLIRKQNENN